MMRGIVIMAALLPAFIGRGAEPRATATKPPGPPVEFSGILTVGGKTKLALTDTSTDITRWVDPGADFNGYQVTRYEPREQAVTLRRAGQEFRLTMVAPKPPAASTTAAAGEPTGRAATVPTAPRGAPPPDPPPLLPAAAPPQPAPVLAPEPPADPPAQTPAPAALPPIASPAPATADPGSPPSATGTNAPATPPLPAGTLTRSVQPGETLETIARTSGLTIEQLLALNPTVNASSLQPGQAIRIR